MTTYPKAQHLARCTGVVWSITYDRTTGMVGSCEGCGVRPSTEPGPDFASADGRVRCDGLTEEWTCRVAGWVSRLQQARKVKEGR